MKLCLWRGITCREGRLVGRTVRTENEEMKLVLKGILKMKGFMQGLWSCSPATVTEDMMWLRLKCWACLFRDFEGNLKASHANEGIHAGDLKLHSSYSNWRKDVMELEVLSMFCLEKLKVLWRHHMQMKGSMHVIWSYSPLTVAEERMS